LATICAPCSIVCITRVCWKALSGIIRTGKVPDRNLFYRLEASPVWCASQGGRLVAGNEVYERFFKAVL